MATQKRLTELFPSRKRTSDGGLNPEGKRKAVEGSAADKKIPIPVPVMTEPRTSRQLRTSVKSAAGVSTAKRQTARRLQFPAPSKFQDTHTTPKPENEKEKAATEKSSEDAEGEPKEPPGTPPHTIRRSSRARTSIVQSKEGDSDDDNETPCLIRLPNGPVSPYRPATTMAVFTPKKSPIKSPAPARTPGSANRLEGSNLFAQKLGRSPTVARDFAKSMAKLKPVNIEAEIGVDVKDTGATPTTRRKAWGQTRKAIDLFPSEEPDPKPEDEKIPGKASPEIDSETEATSGDSREKPEEPDSKNVPGTAEKPKDPPAWLETNTKTPHTAKIQIEKPAPTVSLRPPTHSSVPTTPSKRPIPFTPPEIRKPTPGTEPNTPHKKAKDEPPVGKLPLKEPAGGFITLGVPAPTAGLFDTEKKEKPQPVPPTSPQKFRSRGEMLLAAVGGTESTSKQLLSPTKATALAKIMGSPNKNASLTPPPPRPQPVTPKSAQQTRMRLPAKYEDLERMFEAVDMALRQQKMRGEVLTFKRAKTFVEDFCRRTFEKEHLAQMASVLPDAFTFKCVVCERTAERRDWETNDDRYRLLIEGDLSHVRDDGSVDKVSLIKMQERKEAFYQALIIRVKKHHEKFLSTLDGYKDITRGSVEYTLRSWHPKFKLDWVPHIECVELPKPPMQLVSSARDLLQSATKIPKVIQQALEKVAQRKKGDDSPAIPFLVPATPHKGAPTPLAASQPPSTPTTTPKTTPILNRRLASMIPASILIKVAEKERLKERQQMFGLTESELDRIARVQRCDYVASIMSSYFASQPKRSVLPIDQIVEKVRMSSTAILPSATIQEIIILLSELVPEWVTIVKTTNGVFVKLDKNLPMSHVKAKIEAEKERVAVAKATATARVLADD